MITSYHRYGLRDTTPSKDILRLYRELGGEIITIGSDSHEPEYLGVVWSPLNNPGSLPLLGGQAEGGFKAFGKVGRALETGLHGDFGDGHFIVL